MVLKKKRKGPFDDEPFHSHDSTWYCRVYKPYCKANPVTGGIAKELVVRHLHLSRKRIAEIDINGSNCYCAKCNRELKTKNTFVHHARTVHGLQLPPRTMRNFEAAIGPNDPNWYCSQ